MPRYIKSIARLTKQICTFLNLGQGYNVNTWMYFHVHDGKTMNCSHTYWESLFYFTLSSKNQLGKPEFYHFNSNVIQVALQFQNQNQQTSAHARTQRIPACKRNSGIPGRPTPSLVPTLAPPPSRLLNKDAFLLWQRRLKDGGGRGRRGGRRGCTLEPGRPPEVG